MSMQITSSGGHSSSNSVSPRALPARVGVALRLAEPVELVRAALESDELMGT
jgi:hypothetical protein